MIFLYRIPFVFLGSMVDKRLTTVVAFTIFIYTLNGHKEFRFLTQILPILFILEAHGIDWCMRKVKWNKVRWLVFLSFIGHLCIGVYFSLIDRQGQVSVMRYLRKDLAADKNRLLSIDFLMPCHSTPYHSFLHRKDIQLTFLTCEPNWGRQAEGYLDEADRFFAAPVTSLESRLRSSNASHLVMFDTLYRQVKHVFDDGQRFRTKKILFNSHIQHTSRHGKSIYILERT